MERMTHKKDNLRPKIALYQPDIPQNTAAIIRTCACLGAELEIIQPCGFILTDKRFKRIVMDYTDGLNIKIYDNYKTFLREKKNQRIILMTTKSKKTYEKFSFNIDDTILFGRESSGVPKSIHKNTNFRLKIPMNKNKRSLNISSSVAIVLAENIRQNNYENYR